MSEYSVVIIPGHNSYDQKDDFFTEYFLPFMFGTTIEKDNEYISYYRNLFKRWFKNILMILSRKNENFNPFARHSDNFNEFIISDTQLAANIPRKGYGAFIPFLRQHLHVFRSAHDFLVVHCKPDDAIEICNWIYALDRHDQHTILVLMKDFYPHAKRVCYFELKMSKYLRNFLPTNSAKYIGMLRATISHENELDKRQAKKQRRRQSRIIEDDDDDDEIEDVSVFIPESPCVPLSVVIERMIPVQPPLVSSSSQRFDVTDQVVFNTEDRERLQTPSVEVATEFFSSSTRKRPITDISNQEEANNEVDIISTTPLRLEGPCLQELQVNIRNAKSRVFPDSPPMERFMAMHGHEPLSPPRSSMIQDDIDMRAPSVIEDATEPFPAVENDESNDAYSTEDDAESSTDEEGEELKSVMSPFTPDPLSVEERVRDVVSEESGNDNIILASFQTSNSLSLPPVLLPPERNTTEEVQEAVFSIDTSTSHISSDDTLECPQPPETNVAVCVHSEEDEGNKIVWCDGQKSISINELREIVNIFHPDNFPKGTTLIKYNRFLKIFHDHAENVNSQDVRDVYSWLIFVARYYCSYLKNDSGVIPPQIWFHIRECIVDMGSTCKTIYIIVSKIPRLFYIFYRWKPDIATEMFAFVTKYRMQTFIKETYTDNSLNIPSSLPIICQDYCKYIKISFDVDLEKVMYARLLELYPDITYDSETKIIKDLPTIPIVEIFIIKNGVTQQRFFLIESLCPEFTREYLVSLDKDPSEKILEIDDDDQMSTLTNMCKFHEDSNWQGDISKRLFIFFTKK